MGKVFLTLVIFLLLCNAQIVASAQRLSIENEQMLSEAKGCPADREVVLDKNENIIVVAFLEGTQATPDQSVVVKSSTDQGTTWSKIAKIPFGFIESSVDRRGGLYDTAVAIGEDGTIWIAVSVRFRSFEYFSELVIIHINANGEIEKKLTIASPSEASSSRGGGAVNPVLSYSDGRLYLVYTSWLGLDPRNGQVVVRYSDDGNTWSEEVRLATGAGVNDGVAMVTKGERVYVTFAGSEENVFLFTSEDKGITFQGALVSRTRNVYGTSISGMYRLATAPVLAVGENRVAIAFAARRENGSVGSLLATTNDGDGRWSVHGLTGEDAEVNVLAPAVAIDDTGTVLASWLEVNSESYTVRSRIIAQGDEPLAFVPITVTETSPIVGRCSLFLELGTRLGLVTLAPGMAYLVYPDTRNHGEDVYGARLLY